MTARILIIEDNPDNLELMRYVLEAFGYQALTASNGQEGINVAERALPDLILCDIQLPDIDGYEVVKRIRSTPNLAAIPLIAVTALAMAGDRDKALRAGFDGYLSKPIDPAAFVPQMEAFLSANLGNATLKPATRRTILAVDNVQANLDLVIYIFESSGYRVVATMDAKEVPRLARQTPPDLILSDVDMPEGSGYELIKTIKADPGLSRVPFVFITSTLTNESDRQKGLALGARKFLFRPIEPQELLNEIESCF